MPSQKDLFLPKATQRWEGRTFIRAANGESPSRPAPTRKPGRRSTLLATDSSSTVGTDGIRLHYGYTLGSAEYPPYRRAHTWGHWPARPGPLPAATVLPHRRLRANRRSRLPILSSLTFIGHSAARCNCTACRAVIYSGGDLVEPVVSLREDMGQPGHADLMQAETHPVVWAGTCSSNMRWSPNSSGWSPNRGLSSTASLRVRFMCSTCPLVQGWFGLVRRCSMPFADRYDQRDA